MATIMKTQQISGWLNTERMLSSSWRGTHQNFIAFWGEQFRQVQEMTNNLFSDAQALQMLNTAVQGVDYLEGALFSMQTARKSAGVLSPATLEDYMAHLDDLCSQHDGGSRLKTGNRNRRSVNMTETLLFDDGTEDDVYLDYFEREVCVHDIDTPLSALLEVNNTNTSRPQTRQVRLDKKTWRSLTREDQTAWDTVSDQGKRAIIEYVPQKTDSAQRSVKTHDLQDSDDHDGNRVISVGTHEFIH